jgi:phytol kinase
MSWQTIRLLSIAFFIVVGVSKVFNVFQAIHSVQRPTWGELFFALVVGAITLITQSKAIYAAALLQMSLADGFAAIAGTRFGSGNSYLVLGHKKSLVGSVTFFAVSVAILVTYSQLHGHIATTLIVVTAALATLIENAAVAGLDNLLVPLLVAFILNSVS